MRVLFFILFCCSVLLIYSQNTPEQYIRLYSELAIKEMERAGVPASITLAQGILESGSGNSFLANQGFNHFGIKCHKWEGEKIYADDDIKNECFRKYKNVENSFIDHSDFLRENSRYHFLFQLEITDYEAWAKGLKQAGYATNPNYANTLISIIERYELYKFDSEQIKNIGSGNIAKRPIKNKIEIEYNYVLYPYSDYILYNNDVPYIIVVDTVSLKGLAQYLDIMPWQLAKYNDMDKNSSLYPGDTIYIKHKRNKADKDFNVHIVQENECIRDISQKYAIKSKKLLKYNNINLTDTLKPGSKIKLKSK